MRAYALERTSPGEILHKLTMLMNVARNEMFATVICGLFDTTAGTLTVARAGHPDLLVVDGAGARYLDAPLGPAIGMFHGHRYDEVTVTLEPRTTFLAFTDGLVERRNEHLDTGLERLRAACDPAADLDDLVTRLVDELARDSADDIALLGLRSTAASPRAGIDQSSDAGSA
jgi:serine phosphatase RsbU (regulator of sigma subunit)